MRHRSNEPDEETAVRLALAGKRRMFVLLLERHHESVLLLCRRLLGSEADAQDAAQGAALQAFLGLGRLREPARFRAWLHSIAANLARSVLRRRRSLSLEAFREGARNDPAKPVTSIPPRGCSPQDRPTPRARALR